MKGNKVIEIARNEIGVTENPKNSNKTKYGKWFGLDGVFWCGIFVSYCFDKAGLSLGNMGFLKGFAGCQTAVAQFTKAKRVTTDPQPGDIVFFDWNGDKRHDHTGIFVSWTDATKTKFNTIEGNTSPTNASNGGSVMAMVRSNKNVIFVHPKVLD